MTAAQRLRDKIAAARHEADKPLYLDTPVDGVVIACDPIPSTTLERIRRRHKKARLADLNTAIIIEACVGVHERINGKLVSIDEDDRDGEPLTFKSPRLAEILGVENGSSVAMVRDLFAVTDKKDGAVLGAGDAIAKHSDFSAMDTEEYDELEEK